MDQSTALSIFNYQDNEVRTLIQDNEIWWAASDVCRILDIKDVKQAVNRLDYDERRGYTIPTPGGDQMTTCINEAGLYELMFTSRKPDAKAFKHWVKHEVLPSIRKTGSYSLNQEETPIDEPYDPVDELDQMIAMLPVPNYDLLQRVKRYVTATEELFYPEKQKPQRRQITTQEIGQLTEPIDRQIIRTLQRVQKPMTASKLQGSYLKSYDKCTLLIRCEDLTERGVLRKRKTAHAQAGVYELI